MDIYLLPASLSRMPASSQPPALACKTTSQYAGPARGPWGNTHDILEGVPEFSMHALRSTMGEFVLDHPDVPAGIASLMIAHNIPGDHRNELDRVDGQTLVLSSPAHPGEYQGHAVVGRRLARGL